MSLAGLECENTSVVIWDCFEGHAIEVGSPAAPVVGVAFQLERHPPCPILYPKGARTDRVLSKRSCTHLGDSVHRYDRWDEHRQVERKSTVHVLEVHDDCSRVGHRC